MRPIVIIITFNEQRNIRDCLKSIPPDWEVLVVDSISTDDTQQICKMMGATVISQPWLGYGAQKKFAASAVKHHDWILSIDADERLTRALINEINELELDQSTAAAIPRQSFFLNKKVNFCGWRPDYSVRLFHRASCTFDDRIIHEKIVGYENVIWLKNSLLHYSYQTCEDVERKVALYGNLGSQALNRKFQNLILRKTFAFVRALWAFCRTLIIRLGILDGFTGLKISWMNARVTYMKHT